MARTHCASGTALLALAAAALAACQTGIPAPAVATTGEIITLASGTQCDHAPATAAAHWLDSADDLEAAYRHMTHHTPGADSLPGSIPDFTRYGALQVFMGQRPTGGYRLRLLHPALEQLATGTTVRIAWLSPPPGALTPQVITSPCLLLALPRGIYSSVQVTDQDGRIRATAPLRTGSTGHDTATTY